MKLAQASLLLFSPSALALFLRSPDLEPRSTPTFGSIGVHLRQTVNPGSIVGPLTPSESEAGYSAFCSAASSSSGTNAILTDISNAATSVLSIQTAFTSIAAELAVIDSMGLPTLNPEARNLTGQWAPSSQQWTNVLWASVTTAGNIIEYVEQFSKAIMPEVVSFLDVPVVAVAFLQQYIGEATPLQTNDGNVQAALSTLQEDITSFSGLLGDLAIEDSDSISDLISTIQNLNAQIDQLNTDMVIVAGAIGATALADTILLLLFPEFAPFIIAAGVEAVAGEVATFAELSSERSGLEDQVDQDQNTIPQLQDQETDIAKVNSTLYPLQHLSLPGMLKQLQGFSGVWKAAASDCTLGINYVNNQSKQTIPYFFWAAQQTVPCIYEQFVSALQAYVITVQSSNIPAATASELSANWKTLTDGKFEANVQSIISAARTKAASSPVNIKKSV